MKERTTKSVSVSGLEDRRERRAMPPAMMNPAVMRPARADDLPVLQEIRRAAFAPVFASFRKMLGDELYELVQARDDEAHPELLASLLAPESLWEVHLAEVDGTAVGFLAIKLNKETHVGEIGLNAVHPSHAGQGLVTPCTNSLCCA